MAKIAKGCQRLCEIVGAPFRAIERQLRQGFCGWLKIRSETVLFKRERDYTPLLRPLAKCPYAHDDETAWLGLPDLDCALCGRHPGSSWQLSGFFWLPIRCPIG